MIAIGSDHAGYEYKEVIIQHLQKKNIDFIDLGPYSNDSVDYPDFAHAVARKVESGESKMGILLCGSGNGACMTANKHKDIRAALVWSVELAALARQHNDANIVCIPARFISKLLSKKIVDTFISSDFEGGRHAIRVNKIPI